MSEEEEQYNEAEDRAEINAEAAESYGAPVPEEKINQHTIIREAIKSDNTLKTTFLSRPELGLPLFSVRFYLDMAKLCKIYNSDLLYTYFMNKIKNVSDSGMSNEGFIMKQNVTARRDVTRRSTKEPPKEGENP